VNLFDKYNKIFIYEFKTVRVLKTPANNLYFMTNIAFAGFKAMPANFNLQDGHKIRKDSPESLTCVHTYRKIDWYTVCCLNSDEL